MVVYPVAGRRVRCPVTRRPVPDEGLTVTDGDLFWVRRLRDGDVITDGPSAPPAAASSRADRATALTLTDKDAA